jgi:hypothetical protein
LEPDLEHCKAATGVERRARVEGSGEKCSGIGQLISDVENQYLRILHRTVGGWIVIVYLFYFFA